MQTRNTAKEWFDKPPLALSLAALTAAIALFAFFVMVVQENVQRGAERKRVLAQGAWTEPQPQTDRYAAKASNLVAPQQRRTAPR